MRKNYSMEEIEFIKDNYGRISFKEIAEKLGREFPGVKAKIHRMKLNKGIRADSPNVNISFFEEWSEELAYIVGFFLADGHMINYLKAKCYGILFSVKDKDVLEKIAKVCGYKNNVKSYINETTTMYRISIYSRFVWKFFESLEFSHRKTFTTRIPKQVPQEFMSHFIRGVFDGDGSIWLSNKTYPQVSVVGSELLIEDVSKICGEHSGINKHCKSFVIRYCGQKAINFLNYIYKDATIYMDRKHKRYLKALKWENSRSFWTDQEVGLLKSLGSTTYAVDLINILNRPLNGIRYKATKLNIKIKEKRSKLWNNNEIQLLKELYPVNSAHKMVTTLNRSSSSIRQKACKLGLKKILKEKES